MERKLFSIDDYVSEIEKEYGAIEELTEADCVDIVYTYLNNTECKNAWYDKSLDCIVFIPFETEGYDEEVTPGWNNDYLATLGMSMSDFV